MATFRLPPIPPRIKIVPPVLDWQSGGSGAEVDVHYSGAKALQANLLGMSDVALDAAGYEMANIAAEVISEAKAVFVPIDTGDLQQSGDSDEYLPNRGITVAKIAMWFGGVVGPEAAESGVADVRAYALEQHENMEFRHTVGGPKYLERPFMLKHPTILPRIAAAVNRAWGGSATLDASFEALTNMPAYPGYGPGRKK